jgi:hypothetical protein
MKDVKPDELINGINKRLTLLSYLYGEDEPELFSPSIVTEDRGNNFDVFLLSYQENIPNPLRIERWHDRGKIIEEVAEFSDLIATDQNKNIINEYLENTIETVAIELKLSDTEGLGWPVAISIAAWIAEYADGIAYNENDGWFLPTEKEVKFLNL